MCVFRRAEAKGGVDAGSVMKWQLRRSEARAGSFVLNTDGPSVKSVFVGFSLYSTVLCICELNTEVSVS